MNDEINYKNNPLHGLGLKKMLTELVDHYGFPILYAYLKINCFKSNPSIASSLKFLKKTEWAREKVENLYLYQFKSLPRASREQYLLSPRDRIIPDDQTPGTPAELSIEDAERLHQKRAQNKPGFNKSGEKRPWQNKRSEERNTSNTEDQRPYNKPRNATADTDTSASDPWSKAKINRQRNQD